MVRIGDKMIFKDRRDAGKKLAEALKQYQDDKEAIVIALPRGGVVVGFEVAKVLHLPLDIVCPRKMGAPFNPELAIGAITETGEKILSKDLISSLAISEDYISKIAEEEKKVALSRLKRFRNNRPNRQLKGKKVIIVDDGLATGATMRAAIKTVKAEGAKKIVVAVPVSPPDTAERIENEVDELIALSTPTSFYAVGQFYDHFDQTTDEEVVQLLNP